MQRYDSYKDSGVKWLGEIPSHWELRKIKFSFAERSEKGNPSLPLLAATQNHGVIKKEDYENRTVEAIKSLETLKLVEIGDFVISLRSFQGGIEISYERGIISPAYTILRPMNIEACYFKHLGKSPIFIQLLKSTVTGIREGQNIDYSKLRENQIPIPSIDEQKSIANYLDAATSKIDEAISQQQKMIDLLNERKQIIINNAVTKGLDPNAKMKPSGIDWIGDIPEHWELMRMRYLCKITTGNKDTINRVDDGLYPFYVRSPKVERINSYSYDGEAVLMAGDGVGAGKVFHYVNGKFDFHQRVYCFYGIEMTKAKLLYYYMQNLFKYVIEQLSAKSTVDSVRLNMIQDFLVCIPSIKEQIEIINFIDTKIASIDEAIKNSAKLISLLQERKQIIINDVVTGKVKVI